MTILSPVRRIAVEYLGASEFNRSRAHELRPILFMADDPRMKTIEEQLLDACREIAVHTMWNEETPRSLDDIITVEEREAVAQAYYHEALHQLELVRHYPED